MQGFSYFPSVVYRDEKPEFISNTLNVSNGLLEPLENSRPDSLVYQSEPIGDNPNIYGLSSHIASCSSNILREQGYDIDQYNLNVILWAQKIKPFAGFDSHVHKNSVLCGFYFLEVDDGGSFPVYDDPRPGRLMSGIEEVNSQEVTAATTKVFFGNVVPGTLLLSNSYLPHQLTTNYSKKSTKLLHIIVNAWR